MCETAINIITHQPTDTTCGLCEKYNNCPNPTAINRRKQAHKIDQQLGQGLNHNQINHQIARTPGCRRLNRS